VKTPDRTKRAPADLVRRSEHYRLLADPTRLTIVEALAEGPREIDELARLTGVHRNTVRVHLRKLEAVGLVAAETGAPVGRGRPPLRFRLRAAVGNPNPELRFLIDGLVRALRRAAGTGAAELAEAEGHAVGVWLADRLRHPSVEQAVDQVVRALQLLAFHPELERQGRTYRIRLAACPFAVRRGDDRGDVICPFHLGLMRGIIAGSAPDEVEAVELTPFARDGVCIAEIRAAAAR
jgi:predicted ArsR family transcriptional regulator